MAEAIVQVYSDTEISTEIEEGSTAKSQGSQLLGDLPLHLFAEDEAVALRLVDAGMCAISFAVIFVLVDPFSSRANYSLTYPTLLFSA